MSMFVGASKPNLISEFVNLVNLDFSNPKFYKNSPEFTKTPKIPY